jgi:hypothetical protein
MSRFGWCLDGHHEECRVEYTTDFHGSPRTEACSCPCHEKAEKAPLPEGE